MSISKRVEEKAIEDTQRVAEEAKNVKDKHDAAQTLQQVGQQQQVVAQDFQHTLHRSLDETKENVKKSIDEARTQIPRFTNVVTNYQEQVLQSTGKMVEDYIEAQKSVMNSIFNSANPYYENANRLFNYWFSPRVSTEIYARSVSNIAENISASARIGNDILFGNIEALGDDFERAQRHTKEFTRINAYTAKAIESTAREVSVNSQRSL
jgi:multidrug efflux pump subunit AcrB